MRSLAWVDRQGTEDIIDVPLDRYLVARASPQNEQLALEVAGDLHVWDPERGTTTPLTFDPNQDRYPVWYEDQLLFTSDRGGANNLFLKRADNVGQAERLFRQDTQQFPTAVSPDGTFAVYHDVAVGVGSGSDLYKFNLISRTVEPLTQTAFDERNADISPDGRWLAYQSNETGETEIWVRALADENEGRWRVSTSGGTKPVWSPTGTELFYVAERMMAVPVELGASFSYGLPQPLFPRRNYVFDGPFRNYDISRDGDRFVMIVESAPDEDIAGPEISVVVNWFSELERLVPTN